MSYNVPSKLLSRFNAKTIKGEKLGWITYIMYLAPHKQNTKGKNLCPKASAGCANACLYKSGNARFNRVQQGRINKTDYFLENRNDFLIQLHNEISKLKANHKKKGENDIAIRLNGTADFPFENVSVIDGKSIFELHPDIQFYDYTKDDKRVTKNTLSNYHLTFSRSEINHKAVVKVLDKGFNVAVVFDELPKTYLGYPVIVGDETDLRFLDAKNVIVGLTFKKSSVKGGKEINADAYNSGFAIRIADLKEVSDNMEMLLVA